jgi:hypothetical protein
MNKHTSKHPFAARKISFMHVFMENAHANAAKGTHYTKKDDEA